METGETISGTDRTITEGDGRVFDVPATVRPAFRGGGGDLFILGSNDRGSFVALFVRQDGLPADCHLPGIGATGIERGGSIEIGGVLWPKAASFRPGQSVPAVGSAYPPRPASASTTRARSHIRSPSERCRPPKTDRHLGRRCPAGQRAATPGGRSRGNASGGASATTASTE